MKEIVEVLDAKRCLASVHFTIEACATDIASVDESLAWVSDYPQNWKWFLKAAVINLVLIGAGGDAKTISAMDSAAKEWDPDLIGAFENFMNWWGGCVRGAESRGEEPSDQDRLAWAGMWVLINVSPGDWKDRSSERYYGAPKIGAACRNLPQTWHEAPLTEPELDEIWLTIQTDKSKVDTKKCPYCAEEILEEAIKCKHCGEFFQPLKGKKKLLSEFLSGAAGLPYKDLVQEHLRRSSTRKLMEAEIREVQLLATNLGLQRSDANGIATRFIDRVNEQLGYDQEFWATADCREAVDSIVRSAVAIFGDETDLGLTEEDFKSRNEEVGFQVFQIATLSFAYSASTQRKQRKFMGIKKGLLG